MKVRYLFSSPGGDLPAGESVLNRPFRLSPSEEHPSIILRDYFKTLEHFLLKERTRSLLSLLQKEPGQSTSPEKILEILLRSEKHGGLYHIASAEVVLPGRRRKFAVVSALSMQGKATLHREFETLRSLQKTLALPYLPEVYFKDELELPAARNPETMVMALQEWFEGYHEWHFSGKGKDAPSRLSIWDFKTGNRFASEREMSDIFRQASRILTLYYDSRSSSRIHSWHHAAGDFIVKSNPEGKIDVKLTTVRNYGPMFDFSEKTDFNPWMALIFFFLDLSARMRIDRLDGIGELVWAGDFAVDATLEGFFEGLDVMATGDRFHPGKPQEVLSLLKAFSREELLKLTPLLLDDYEKTNPREFPIILANLETHVTRLNQSIQNFSL